jgi:hypothetical protein
LTFWPALALVALIASMIGAIWLAGRRQGLTTTEKNAAEAEVAAAKRIADAEANAPSDRDALVERLRDDGREL